MSSSSLKGNIFELQPLEIRRLLTTASVDGAGILQILGTASGEDITVNRNSSLKLTVTGVATTFTPGTSAGQVKGIFIQAGGGNDTVLLTNNVRFPSNNAGIPATIAGNAGNDTITSGPGNDLLSGNDGDDVLDGGVGNDTMTGGANTDTTNYSTRSTAIRVTINNDADADGELSISENDKVSTEEVIGGAGNDTITGSNLQDFIGGGAGADSLSGGDGNDVLTGSTGSDKGFGNNGDDALDFANSDIDTVNGGTNSDGTPDFDSAHVDLIDVGSRGTNFAPAGAPPVGSALDLPYGGATDTSAADDGKAKAPLPFGWDSVAASAVDAQGRVYFAGSSFGESLSGSGYGWDFVVARFDENGIFDTSFNGGAGQTRIDFTLLDGVGNGYGNAVDFAGGITVAPDGKIIVVGSHQRVDNGNRVFAVARLNANGTLDASFNSGGTQIVDIVNPTTVGTGYGDNAVDAVVGAGNSVTVVGSFDDGQGGDFAVARLTNAGALDTTFNTVGYTTIDINDGSSDSATAVGIQTIASDTNSPYIVVGGVSDDTFAIARIRNNGTTESAFEVPLGGTSAFLADLAIASNNNNIVAVGNVSDFVIGKGGPQPVQPGEEAGVVVVLSPQGSVLDSTEQDPGDSSFLAYNAVHIDGSNRIVVAGETDNDFIVGRYLPSLNFDSSFDPNGLVKIDFSDPNNEVNEQDFPMAIRTITGGAIVVSGLNLPDSESAGNLVAAKMIGQGAPATTDIVEEVEAFFTYDDVHGNPPPSPFKEKWWDHLSQTAKNYMLWQPDDDGVVRINLDGRTNIVLLSNIIAGDGQANVLVNVDGLAVPYVPGATARIEINTGGGDDVVMGCTVNIPLIVNGGDGDDVVVGSDSDDIINGGNGADILIGCNGADQLNGDAGEDILIGGHTSWDENLLAVQTIMQEWSKAPPNQSGKVSHLTNTGNGGLNNPYKLNAGINVTDDGAVDILTGGTGSDWFFKKNGANADIITDTAELLYVIP